MTETAGSDVKQVQIAGARPKDLMVKRRRRTRKQEGGAEAEMLATTPTIVKVDSPPAMKGGNLDPKTHVPTVPPPTGPATSDLRMQGSAAPAAKMSNSPPGPALQVGGADTKVILKSKVKRTAKVLLKKKDAPGPAVSAAATPAKPLKVKTRKVILKSLNKRLKKTRHAVKQAAQLPIQQVRAVLVDKGLIKATSKAPETVLRQIYSDSLIVAKKTL
jgi:hypothetical protein